MLVIERAEQFYGTAPDGYPEWDDLTEAEQDEYAAELVTEGKITECEFVVGWKTLAFANQSPAWCDREADPVTGYCDDHWDEIQGYRP